MSIAPLAGVTATAMLYGHGVRRLWRVAGRGHGITTREAACFGAGLLAVALALVGPLDAAADALFSAHMTQHLILIGVAAPLLALGSPIVAMLWAFPSTWRSAIGHWWGRRPRTRTLLVALGGPVAVWVIHAVVVALWHVPAAYDYAIAHDGAHLMEHLSYLVTAAAFWWTALPRAGARRLGYGPSTLYIAAAGAVMGIFGAVLTFARAPFYTEHAARVAAWGLTPIGDQQLAGLIMWVPAGLIYLAGALWCFSEWLSAEPHGDPVDNRVLSAAARPLVTAAAIADGGDRDHE
jgi:putative membrane protein